MPLQSITAHGATIPVIGFGTWNINGEECARSVAEAIKVGYRHIDTAAGYRNEDRVGEGIRDELVCRVLGVAVREAQAGPREVGEGVRPGRV